MSITARLAAASGDPDDTEILRLAAQGAAALARYRRLLAENDLEAERPGSEGDRAWQDFTASENAILAIPANTPSGALAKLRIAVKLLHDGRPRDDDSVILALRGDVAVMDGDDLLDHAVIAAAADLARIAGVDPVPNTLAAHDDVAEPAPAADAGATAAMLATDLLSAIETLAARVDFLAGAAETLGNTMGAVDHPGAHDSANLFFGAGFILESLHRDVADLIEDAARLRRAVHGQEGGAS